MPVSRAHPTASTLIGKETYTIGGRRIKVYTYLEKRANCRAAIGRKGVHIRLSEYMTKAEQKDQYESLKKWALQHLEEKGVHYLAAGGREYPDDSTFSIGGKTFTIRKKYTDKERSTGQLKGSTMTLYLSTGMTPEEEQRHSSYLVSRLTGNAFLPAIRQRLETLNIQHFRRPIGRVRMRNNVSNWGSCSYDGNISISTRLLFAPPLTIDYVLIHELAHLVEHNHSNRFWKQVELAMPNYREHEKWLDDNVHICHF